MSFSVVLFLETNEIEVVPSLWVENDSCVWPLYTNSLRLRKAIRDCEEPQDAWNTYPIKIYKSCGKY